MNLPGVWMRLSAGAASRLRNAWYRALGVRIGGYVWLRKISVPRQWEDIELEQGASLDDGVVLLCSGAPKARKLVIGRGTYVNRNTVFDAHNDLRIGRDCMIGPGCFLTDSDHGTEFGVLIKNQPMVVRSLVLEDDVWLGAGVTVLGGVTIGRGAVVGAGSVVTKHVPRYAKVVGVPGRIIGERMPAAK